MAYGLRKTLEEAGVDFGLVRERRWVLDEEAPAFDDETEFRADCFFFFFETLEIAGVTSCAASRCRLMRLLMRMGAILLY